MSNVNESGINIMLHYPFNEEYDYITQLERIDMDKERENDIRTGKGFIIDEFKGIKKDIKAQGGIFSIRFGNTMYDADSFSQQTRCDCGLRSGAVRLGDKCEYCDSLVRYRDDELDIFAWLLLNEQYCYIHPNIYRSLEAFIGATRLDNILNAEVHVDVNGKIVENTKINKKEPFKGIGILDFRDRFDEIMDYYLKKYPQKKLYYDDIMSVRDIVFPRSIPVFTIFLRPVKLDNGVLKYEGTNENYNLLSRLVYECNNDKRHIYRKKKHKLKLLYDIQYNFNEIYNELKETLAKKKGDIRSAVGGRFDFTERSVIAQGVDLKPYEIRLPYHGLVELLQQVIINILDKTYNFGYAEAYKIWYKAQLKFNKIVYDIIDGLIKDSEHGLPVLINRNPSINFGSVLFMYCVGINKDYTMTIPLPILIVLGADFDRLLCHILAGMLRCNSFELLGSAKALRATT